MNKNYTLTHAHSGGRLGNHIIRNIALLILVKKNGLYAEYYYSEEIEKLGIVLYSGEKKHTNTIKITDNNYISFLDKTTINSNLNLDYSYFQTKEITNVIHSYLKTEEVKNEIENENPYKERYNNNNDLFIHIRLGDVYQHGWNISKEYYEKCIERCKNSDNIYIASDSLDSVFISELQKKYKNIKLVSKNEIETIQFGSTCKYVSLSHGSFSAIIGYISFYSKEIYYSDEPNVWGNNGCLENKGFINISNKILNIR